MKVLALTALFLAIVITLVNGLCWPEHIQEKFCKSDYVVRAKIQSHIKYEVPALPDTPAPRTQKPGHRGKGRRNGHNKTDKPGKNKQHIDELGPAPFRQMAPEPRLRRSLAAPSGIGGRFRRFGIPRYQDIKIKRIIKGVGHVEKTIGAKHQDKNTTYPQYFARVYFNSPYFRMERGKWYLITGKIIQNKLMVSYCDWSKEWEKLNLDQLHSLRKDFIQGCKCHVQTCFSEGCEEGNKPRDVCMWKPDRNENGAADCKMKHSSCRAVNGECQWKHTSRFVQCLKDRHIP